MSLIILRIKENNEKKDFLGNILSIFFFVFLESSDTYPKKCPSQCSAMISVRRYEIILLAMNNIRLRGINVVAERRLSILLNYFSRHASHACFQYENIMK